MIQSELKTHETSMRRIDVKQNTPEWEELRRNKIGASDAAIIMTGSEHEKHALFLRKISGEKLPVTPAMQRGHDLEPDGIAYAEIVTGLSFEKVTALHDTHDWLMASFDGWNAQNNLPLEIKCPGTIPEKVSEAKSWDKYYWQVQTQMCVANAERAFIVLYSDTDSPVYAYVERNDGDIQKILKECGDFYALMQTPDDYPVPYQERLDDEWFRAAEDWRVAKEAYDAADKELARAKQTLILLSEANSSRGNGVSLTRVVKKGAVDYARVPQLQGVDLEIYRKAPVVSWTPRRI